MKKEAVIWAQELAQPIISLDAPVDEEGTRFGDLIPVPNPTGASPGLFDGPVGRLLGYLPRNMQLAVERRAVDGLAPTQIADELGVTESAVKQLYMKGLEALRRIIENPELLVPEQSLLEALKQRLDISEVDRQIVRMRLGFGGYEPQEWQSIGEAVGKARSSAQRAFDNALSALGLSPQILVYKE